MFASPLKAETTSLDLKKGTPSVVHSSLWTRAAEEISTTSPNVLLSPLPRKAFKTNLRQHRYALFGEHLFEHGLFHHDQLVVLALMLER